MSLFTENLDAKKMVKLYQRALISHTHLLKSDFEAKIKTEFFKRKTIQNIEVVFTANENKKITSKR